MLLYRPAGLPRVDITSPASKGLILDIPPGNTLRDAVGGRQFVNNGNAAFGYSPYGAAVSLNGSSQYLSVPASSFAVPTGDWTYAFAANTTFAGAVQPFLSAWDGSSSGRNIYFYFASSLLRIDVPWLQAVFTASPPSSGTWHRYLLAKSGTLISLYIDGALAGSGTLSITQETPTTSFLVGKNSGGSDSLNGSIGGLRIWNRGLSAREAQLDYQQPFGVYARPARTWIPATPSPIILTGADADTVTGASTGAIVQTHVLSAANAGATTGASTGAAAQTHLLAGADADASTGASTGALIQTHALAGADADALTGASTGAVAQTHILAGANASAATGASTGAISLQIALVGANASTATGASTGAIAQVHLLSGANADAATGASTGDIAQTHILVGANANVATEASTGLVHGAETILEGADATAATEASTGSIHTFEVSPSFAADFVADFAAAAKGVLTDRAVWRSADGSAAALDGFFDQDFGTDLNNRAQPARSQFALFEADDPGVAIGDSLVVGGVEYAVADRRIDRAVGELILTLRQG